MAFWNIPICRERGPLDTIFDDIFDWSFPSSGYRLVRYPSHDPRRQAIQRKHQQGGEDDHAQEDRFRVSLDVHHYAPDEINLKVDGKKLLVTGKHYKESEYGFESSEFERSYPIPEDIDPNSFTSRILDNGLLEIEAAKLKKEPLMQADQAVNQDETNFKATFDVSEYKPEEVSVKVQGNLLQVCGVQKSERKDNQGALSHIRQFSRQILLPKTVKLDSLQSKWTKEGKLIIEADQIPAIEPEERLLQIELETEQGKMIDG